MKLATKANAFNVARFLAACGAVVVIARAGDKWIVTIEVMG